MEVQYVIIKLKISKTNKYINQGSYNIWHAERSQIDAKKAK